MPHKDGSIHDDSIYHGGHINSPCLATSGEFCLWEDYVIMFIKQSHLTAHLSITCSTEKRYMSGYENDIKMTITISQ